MPYVTLYDFRLDIPYNGPELLKITLQAENISKNYIIKQPIRKTPRIFWNVMEIFGNNNPS